MADEKQTEEELEEFWSKHVNREHWRWLWSSLRACTVWIVVLSALTAAFVGGIVSFLERVTRR